MAAMGRPLDSWDLLLAFEDPGAVFMVRRPPARVRVALSTWPPSLGL